MLKQLYRIFSQHLFGFYDENLKKWSVLELISFFMLPALFTFLLLSWMSEESLKQLMPDLLVAVSIFVGFLINMLMPFFSFIESTTTKVNLSDSNEERKNFNYVSARISQYKSMYSHVAAALVLCLFSIPLLIIDSRLQLPDYILEKLPFITQTRFNFTIESFALYLVFLASMNLLKIVTNSNSLIYPELKKKQLKRK